MILELIINVPNFKKNKGSSIINVISMKQIHISLLRLYHHSLVDYGWTTW